MTSDTGGVDIDGSRGEGGGQILRTSLALAMITGRPLRMHRIRAGRAKPGLRRQHLACVEAAAQLSHADVRGATLGSQELEFVPRAITGGELMIDIGTAGSTTLVVQTILVPAIVAGHPLRAVIRGGTHNPLAPPFEFLDRVYLPHLRAMGADISLTLDRHGFASGGSPSEAAPSGKHERRSSDARRDRRPRDLLAEDSAESHPRRTRRSPDPRSSEPATEQRRHRPISDSAESILPAGRSQGAPASESFADHRRHLPASDSAESHPPADSARDASASEAFADHRQHLPTNDFAESHPPADSARDAPASEAFADHRRHLPTSDSVESDSPGDRRLADFRTFDSAEPGRSRDRHSRHDNEAKADGARGHGQLTLSVGAGGALRPIELLAAGPVLSRRATAILARLPTHVAEREHAIVQQRLGFAATDCEVREVPDGGPANVLLLEIERACGRELVSAFGEKGLRAELVARRACDQLASFLAAGVPVGEHLADQLLLPLALAGGGRFRAAPLSLHATTNIETIQRFLDVQISVEPDGDAVTVNVG